MSGPKEGLENHFKPVENLVSGMGDRLVDKLGTPEFEVGGGRWHLAW